MNYKVLTKDELTNEKIDKYICFYDYKNFEKFFDTTKYVDSNKANTDRYLKEMLKYSYSFKSKTIKDIPAAKILPWHLNASENETEFNRFSDCWENVKAIENLFILLSTNKDIQTIVLPTVRGFQQHFRYFDAYVLLVHRIATKFCSSTLKNIIFVVDDNDTYEDYSMTIDLIKNYKKYKNEGSPAMQLELYDLEVYASGVTKDNETGTQIGNYAFIPHDTYLCIEPKFKDEKEKYKLLCMHDKTNPESKWMLPHLYWSPDDGIEYYVDDVFKTFGEEFGIETELYDTYSYVRISSQNLARLGYLEYKSESLPIHGTFEFQFLSISEIENMDFEEDSRIIALLHKNMDK